MPNTEPLVSIIIPTYNRAHLIGETLDSVLAQTYLHWECIIVDDGSTDNTDAVVQTYVAKDTRFQYHHRPPEHLPGGNGARNFGFKMSRGEYVIFLDSDDLLIKETILNRIGNINFYKCDFLVNLTGSFRKNIGDSEIIWNKLFNKHSYEEHLLRFINIDIPWHTTSVTWNRKYFALNGIWNEKLIAWQDWELHCRILFLKPNITIIEDRPDHFFRISRHASIGKLIKTESYFDSVYIAVLSINQLLSDNAEVFEYVKKSYFKFICNVFIIYPLKNSFNLFPIKIALKRRFFIGCKRIVFLKYYLKGLVFKSFKIRKYILGNYYSKHLAMTQMESTYLKLTIKALNK
ncbi:MAG: glycosyltransferase [Bacteroidetes bacterium]|nr:glycosyltransferase [Bacteroidota bacterium]